MAAQMTKAEAIEKVCQRLIKVETLKRGSFLVSFKVEFWMSTPPLLD
jgi:hypothetical protein